MEYTAPDEVSCCYYTILFLFIKSCSFKTALNCDVTLFQVAVCNLASIAMNKFVTVDEENITLPSGEIEVQKKYGFDFKRLKEIAKVCTRNLNKVIDRNFYPCEEAKNSNMRHRPIGIGIQVRVFLFVFNVVMVAC